MKTLHYEEVDVDPERAAQLLEHCQKNRRLFMGRVKHYADMMEHGQWKMTAETIKFDTQGRLLDGQHRLHAIIHSRSTVRLCLARGLTEDTMRSLDTGRARSPADIGEIDGVPCPRLLMPALRIALWYEKLGHLPHRDLYAFGETTPFELLEFFDTLRSICASIPYGERANPVIAPALGLFFHYAASRVSSPVADAFMDAVIDGANLAENAPEKLCRDYLMTRRPFHRRSSERFLLLGVMMRAFRWRFLGQSNRFLKASSNPQTLQDLEPTNGQTEGE